MARTLTLDYGTSEIVAYEGSWRIEVYRPLEVHPKEPWNAAVRERVMCEGHTDESPRHDKQTRYDARCSCCYLNITHTVNAHDRRAP